MIEVTCSACGTMQRVSEISLPPQAVTAQCRKCKAPMALPGRGVEDAGGTGDIIDLVDLPAPVVAKPRPVSGPGVVDLPAPSLRKPSGGVLDLPAPSLPRTSPRAAGPDVVDLPVPVAGRGVPPARPGAGVVDLPAPSLKTSTLRPLSEVLDLPAPSRRGALPSIDAGLDLDDLLAPAGDGSSFELADLPAPRRANPLEGLPAPKSSTKTAGPLDLPAPKGSAHALGPLDLPAPKGSVPGLGPLDLPTPKSAGKSAGPLDLPTPKGSAHALGPLDLPTPKGSAHALGPLDLPAPKSSSAMLPAPKDFFDDLPEPAPERNLPTPQTVGRSNLPSPQTVGRSNLPTPQTVGRSNLPTPQAEGRSNLPRPKAESLGLELSDLFGDVGPASTSSAPAAGARPSNLAEPPPALPEPLDLDDLDLGMPGPAAPTTSATRPRTIDDPLIDLGDDLGLELPSKGRPTRDFGDLDLPSTNLGPAAGAGLTESAKPTTEKAAAAKRMAGSSSADISLDLEDTSATPAAVRTEKARAANKAAAVASTAPDPRASQRKRKLIAGGALVTVVLGAGGFWFYNRWDAKQKTKAAISTHIKNAQVAIAAADPGHWQRAITQANAAVALSPGAGEAQALLAEAHFAAALDLGLTIDRHLAQGRVALAAATSALASGPAFNKASALERIVEDQPKAAIAKLTNLATTDGDAALFLGWAHEAAGQPAEAIAAFTQAMTLLPARELSARLGRGRAEFARGDLAAARSEFAAALGIDAGNIAAQVGTAAAAAPEDLGRREAQLLALLDLPAVATSADTRAVALAYQLAGDDARRGGRFDAARERLHKAQALLPKSKALVVALAEVDLREGKYDAAAETIAPALTPPPGDPLANLVAAEIDLQRSRVAGVADDVRANLLASAGERLTPLLATPQLLPNPRSQARLLELNGRLLEATPGKENEALESYAKAIALGPDFDLSPTIASATLYNRMAAATSDAVAAAGLRSKASEALQSLDARANSDAAVALALGTAYLDSDPAKAETTLSLAVAAKLAPDLDIEARYQLAKAQARLGKQELSLATLNAAYAVDKSRTDVGLELARSYENAGRDTEAEKIYGELLANPAVSITQRGRAGRFYARIGKLAEARAQGDALAALDDNNAAGLYLRGIGAMVDGHPADAGTLIQRAIDLEPEAQYWDSLGAAREAQITSSTDTVRRDQARQAYDKASELAPKLLHSRVRSAALSVELGEYKAAIKPLTAAEALAPGNVDVAYLFGVAYAELGETKAAIAWLQRSLKDAPRADAFHRLGQMYFAKNDASGAANALTRATQLAEDDFAKTGQQVVWLTDAYYLLGLVESSRGNDRGTREAWTKWLQRSPTDQIKVDNVRAQLQTL